MEKRGYLWLIGICVIVGVSSFILMTAFLKSDMGKKPVPQTAQAAQTAEQEKAMAEQAVATDMAKIQPSTKMVYQYYYPVDGVMKEQEDTPPYFLLDRTFQDMQSLYEDWQIVSFSNAEVVMRRTMEGKSEERYIVSQKDGFVAVFYEEEQNGESLHELTDTPLSSLPIEERERLKEGISVTGEENLSKILADYGS